MGFATRQPTSNDIPKPREGKNPWLGDSDCVDELALVLNGTAKRCAGPCVRVTHVHHLDSDGKCPDCRGAKS